MLQKESIVKKARSAKLLDERVGQNVASQEINLVDWIFKRFQPGSGSKVLELCCGTGMQTRRLIEMVGSTGCVVGLDISKEALEKVQNSIPEEKKSRLHLIHNDMAAIREALRGVLLKDCTFDAVFCAYGLYYSSDVHSTLAQIKECIHPHGRVVIVGPFGPNNKPLFNLLKEAGMEIPAYVKWTSTDFMFTEVVPWCTLHFESLHINTCVNRVKWENMDSVMKYWENSTFYDMAYRDEVARLLSGHFEEQSSFTNEKWVMMVESRYARK